jgi:hypothetical protein
MRMFAKNVHAREERLSVVAADRAPGRVSEEPGGLLSYKNPAIHSCLREAEMSAAAERRLRRRYPFFRAVTIAVGDDEGRELSGFCRDISPAGIGLLHRVPVREGSVIVRLPALRGRHFNIGVEIEWCTPGGAGWYLSGGKFASMLGRPIATFLFAALKAEINRRLRQRIPFFRPISIGLDAQGNSQLFGFSRDISPDGIGLLHGVPLDSGKVSLDILSPQGHWHNISTDIRWCKAAGEGWYVSGGSFLSLLLEELPALLL